MHRSKKIDSTASERLVFFAFPQKQSMTHENGNFICRWREIMLDVSHFTVFTLARLLPKAPLDTVRGLEVSSTFIRLAVFLH
jgi:hypothetical protein